MEITFIYTYKYTLILGLSPVRFVKEHFWIWIYWKSTWFLIPVNNHLNVTFATKLTNGNLNLKTTKNVILQIRNINVTCLTLQLYIRHIQDHWFTCEICGKSFYTNPELQGHCAVHIGEKHECETYGKGFSLKGNLLLHLQIHDQNR
jgi:DNA-binding helix-hairpin-helix protein with protein kinase domain